MYLHEQWIDFGICMLSVGKFFEIHSISYFIEIYGESSPREKDLLREIYQLNFFLDHETEWNPNLVV